jgi:hypothetical protein
MIKKKLPNSQNRQIALAPQAEYQGIDKVWQVLTDLVTKGE